MKDMAKRKQICSTDYDYSSPGAYFVTFCVVNRNNKTK